MTARTEEKLSPMQRNLPLQHSGSGNRRLPKKGFCVKHSFELKVTMLQESVLKQCVFVFCAVACSVEGWDGNCCRAAAHESRRSDGR